MQQIDLSSNKFATVPESLSLVGKSLKYLTFNNNPIIELNDDSFVGKTSKYFKYKDFIINSIDQTVLFGHSCIGAKLSENFDRDSWQEDAHNEVD